MKWLFIIFMFFLFIFMMRYPALIIVLIGVLFVMTRYKKPILDRIDRKYIEANEKKQKKYEEKLLEYKIPGDCAAVTYLDGSAPIAKAAYYIWSSNDNFNLFPATPREKSEEYYVFQIAMQTLKYYLQSQMQAADPDIDNVILDYTKQGVQYSMMFENADLIALQAIMPDKYVENKVEAQVLA